MARKTQLALRPTSPERGTTPVTTSSNKSSETSHEPESREKRKLRPNQLKTKTGCFTCRERRVKCDETKPACLRCQKRKQPCVFPQENARVPQSNRVIVPKVRSLGPKLQEEEGRYFQFFCDNLSASITGPFNSSVWNRLIPQAGEAEPFIRHAITALGALGTSRAGHENTLVAQSGWQRSPHYQFGLKEYGKALEGMKHAIDHEPGNPRRALIACLLVFCFESLNGRQATASLHATSGVNLLYQIYQDQIRAEDETAVTVCAKRVSLEEDLYLAFSELDLQALLFLDKRPMVTHYSLVSQMNDAIPDFVEDFTSLKACRTYFHLIMRRNFHWSAIARSQLWGFVAKGDETSKDGVESRLTDGNNAWTFNKLEHVDIPPHLVFERKLYLDDVERWQRASTSLFAATGFEASSWTESRLSDFVTTNLLKINAYFNIITLTCYTLQPFDSSPDEYTHEFRSIVKLSALVYPHVVRKDRDLFRFDIGILPALAMAANFCRDYKIRKEAVELLLRTPDYREGIWDAGICGTMGKALMELEERYRDETGFISLEDRFMLVHIETVLSEKRCSIRVKQMRDLLLKDDSRAIHMDLAW